MVREDIWLREILDVKGGKGPIEDMFINEIPQPMPAKARALVKVKAFGVNRMALMQRRGEYYLPPQAPRTMGAEYSGIIEEYRN